MIDMQTVHVAPLDNRMPNRPRRVLIEVLDDPLVNLRASMQLPPAATAPTP